MINVINSWKNKKVFEKQLNLNLNELRDKTTYPPHWKSFIEFINQIKPNTLLDVGCGCGSLYELCRMEFPTIEYTGVDYSEDAIEIAKNKWNYNRFYVKNYLSLTNEYLLNYDLIHLGALLDVLPNADEALEFILSLNANKILIGRVKLTDKESFYDIYKAYDEIETYAYHHNKNNFLELCNKFNYNVKNIDNNFYLEKNGKTI
jgi:trans-aconitate methyltransferase